MKTIAFKSTGTAPVLTGVLSLLLAGELISTALNGLTAIWIETKNIAFLTAFAGKAEILAIASFLVLVAAGIIFIVWAYNLHKDLLLLYPDYPITPGGALRRLMIPFYNLWGFWDIFKNISNHFEKETEDLQRSAQTIIRLVTAMYVIGFASKTLSKIVMKWSEDDMGTAYFMVSALSYVVDAMLTVVWMKLIIMFKQIFTGKVHSFGCVVRHPIEGYTIVSASSSAAAE